MFEIQLLVIFAVGPTMEEQMEMEQHAMSRHHPDGPMGTMGGPNINTLANPSAAANLLNQLGLAPDSFNAAVIQQVCTLCSDGNVK